MSELLLVVGFVLATSAFCSLCEAVLYSVPASHVESLVHEGRTSGRILREMRAEIDRPIAAILFLNTVANTGGAAVAGAIVDQLFGTNYIVYFSITFTLVILVFSEMLPKTGGVVYCRGLAPVLARPLQGMVWALRPVVWASRCITRVVSKGHEQQRVSDEELMIMVRMGMRSGDFKEHEARVIKNVLALERKAVRDIMTPRTVMFTLPAKETIGGIRERRLLQHFSRIPVYAKDNEDIVGIVHRADVLTAMADDRFDVRLEELMAPADFVLDATSLDELLATFLKGRRHMMVAIDEHGGIAGVVTLEDVLEEIIGREIVDEFDQVTDLRKMAKQRRADVLGRRSVPARASAGGMSGGDDRGDS
ncbi:MAG: HlyC/CorC family transporter [Vicinamibacteria bacterium]|nr:HlyC/CorC family transporter [Vicinamibacteria bacterium]